MVSSKTIYLAAADALLLTHIIFVAFVTIGLLLILVGRRFSWSWVRNPWFRIVHLAGIVVVVLQSWLGVICPLTIWEMEFRAKAGDAVYTGSFIAHWLEGILYYEAPDWAFIVCYTTFGLLVLLSWFWVRPFPFASKNNSENTMNKTILYRLFGVGSVPKKVRPVLEREGIVALDEGIGGWFITKHVNAPGKRYRHRTERFSGCLVVTKARVACYTYGKRQINISVEDPRIASLCVDTPTAQMLCLSFESSDFHEERQGVIVFRFATDQALSFREALVAIGAQQGTACANQTL